MSWSRSGFSRHYKRVAIKGNSPERLINLCLIKNISLRKVRFNSREEISVIVKQDDYDLLKEIAAGRYKITIIEENGYSYFMSGLLKKKILMAGLLLFIGILIYQGMFISEIEVSGYESISEESLRNNMKESGFYEGCRKNINLEKVKLHIYEEFDNISWVGIKYKGNLAQVTVAETDFIYRKGNIPENFPCNIVAAVNGYIYSIDPEQGIRMVEDGSYVKAGDIVIAGAVPLQKTTYNEESNAEQISYVHAAGTVEAKVPIRLNYCTESNEYIKNKTGRKMVTLSFNDKMLFRELCQYEQSQVRSIPVLNCVKPVRMKFEVNFIDEVKLQQRKRTKKDVKKQVLNEIHKFAEEKLPDNTQILNKSLNFTREKNIIYIGVTLETLQEIGIEEEIVVDKSNRESD